jgi:hypothetical protein
MNDKSLDEFPPDRRAKDGKQSKCRFCINEWIKNHYRSKPAEHMLRRARARATKNGFEFSITLDDILPLPDRCPVFGVPLRIGFMSQDPWSYSLDRVDNSKGYIQGNVVVMSYKANRLKNDGTAEDHETIALWIRAQAANDNNTGVTRAAEQIGVVVS